MRGAAVISRQTDFAYMRALSRAVADSASKTRLAISYVHAQEEQAAAESNRMHIQQAVANEEEEDRVTTMDVLADHTRGEVEGLLAMFLVGVGVQQVIETVFIVSVIVIPVAMAVRDEYYIHVGY